MNHSITVCSVLFLLQANTFFARPDLKRPPGRMAYTLADGKKKARDKLSAEIKIGRLSATLFDDMAGLVCILNCSWMLMFGISRTFLSDVILQFQNIYLDWVPYIETGVR